MTDAKKIETLVSALRGIATMSDLSEANGRTAEGQFNRARILAKIALKQIGVPAESGGFHSFGHSLHYNDLPDGPSRQDASKT